MIANAESVPQDVRDEESRVLEFIATCPEGASYFTVTTELGMARSRSVSILEKLHRDGKLSYDCKTKMYFSKPQVKEVITRPPQKDRLAEYERKVEAGEIPDPDPEADRAAPDRFPPEERLKNRCQFCGKVVEKYLWQHENYCKENPNRKLPPGVAAKKRKEEAKEPAPAPEPEEPVPIDDTVPPLSRLVTVATAPLPECGGEACTIGTHDLTGFEALTETLPPPRPGGILNIIGCCEPKADPLTMFAQQHRVRVGREISKLKRVERKLRRRAAAAEAMADRVHAARRTKERELRRFEKELAEVGA